VGVESDVGDEVAEGGAAKEGVEVARTMSDPVSLSKLSKLGDGWDNGSPAGVNWVMQAETAHANKIIKQNLNQEVVSNFCFTYPLQMSKTSNNIIAHNFKASH
jgi:hypothetical protein